ncbi:rifin [Plasmodium reichenowi]|uniref:Rifin n=1 Tax=Plasmodium reichenowi TaxID=5854 RepID=A0A060RR85_PLARE|nr:rifin [Plasmodium reichenowi]
MNVHYINILLFALPLNILVYNQRNHNSTTHHTQNIPITRLLCECELYVPANYDNDLEMKSVMENFNKQTQQRFHEYDERMKNTRQKCKDQCDKEIQKIILKDKLEKQMEQQLTTLETKINTDDIPTCICEKSLADKVEKECLRCAQNLGGIVAPSTGLFGEISALALNAWQIKAIDVATKYATAKGLAFGKVAGDIKGMKIVIGVLKQKGIAEYCPEIYQSMLKIVHFTELKNFSDAIIAKHGGFCSMSSTANPSMCKAFGVELGTHLANGNPDGPPVSSLVPELLDGLVADAQGAAEAEGARMTAAKTAIINEAQEKAIEAASTQLYTTIAYSILAILIIVLIMVIIYLVLRYRRKKKMKKKLQYIKLLEE